jgi:hypothetical protein
MTTLETTGSSGSHQAHARLSPSSSHQWTHCTGSIAYLEANKHRVPKDTSSKYSNEGTIAHDHAADVLLGKKTIAEIPEEFQVPVGLYVDHCLSLVPEGAEYLVEVSIPLWYQPDQNGTCDFAVLTPDHVVIRDLKYGAGVLVSAEDNSQLAIYAFSLINSKRNLIAFHEATVVDLGIFQPRHREAQDAVPWVISLRELALMCKEIDYKAVQCNEGLRRTQGKFEQGKDVTAKEILEFAPALKFHPEEGDEGACRWCKAKGFCEVRFAKNTEGIGAPEFDPAELLAAMPDLTKPEKKLDVEERIEVIIDQILPNTPITDAMLVKFYERSKGITKFLEDIAEYLENRVMAGTQIEGLKLVMGRQGNRAWVDEDAADTFLKNQKLKEAERYTFKLKSPTQVEEILAEKLKSSTRTANRFNELVSRSSAQKTLALASDKREAVAAVSEVMPDIEEIEDYEI